MVVLSELSAERRLVVWSQFSIFFRKKSEYT